MKGVDGPEEAVFPGKHADERDRTRDNNGNTTTDETGRQYVYDAWNHLVDVKTSVGTRLVRFSYDALGRRVKEENGTAKEFYSSAAWQLLEERLWASPTSAKMQYVWSPVYVDAMVLRVHQSG